ncbi:MAG: hypothetical protein Q9170_006243 [Blastenia crenularia]
MFSLLSLIALFTTLVSAIGTPPGYLPSTNTTLGLKYGNITVKPGSILSQKGSFPSPIPASKPQPNPLPLPPVVKTQPLLTLPTANTTQPYLAIFIDPTANLSLSNPSSLLWFQPNVTFSSPFAPASLAGNATVPYLAPSVPGHVYIALLYKQPPNFFIPPDFPYNATFRKGFNSASNTVSPTAMVTGHVDATSTVSLFQFATATTQPFVGGGASLRKSGFPLWSSLFAVFVYIFI